MKIVASNSLTLSNVNDGTITHTAYAYSADGTDRFTTAYPNLNLSNNTQLNYDILPTGISNGGGTDKSEKIAITDLPGFSWGRKYTPSTRVAQSGMRVVTDVSKLKIGDTITNSYWVKNTGNRPIKFLAQIGFRYGNETEPSEGVSTGWNYTSGSDIEVKNDGKWTKLTFTTIIPQPTVASNRTGDILKSVVHYAYSSGAMMPLAVTDTFIISPLKLEQGSTATPWMPSASEVTTADWPSYIGQCTDFTQADSTNPSAYTWSLIRGNDGKDGATGPQGPQGNTGATGPQGPTGPAGSNGNPGKIVSETEPTSRFKGLTWKYSGTTDLTASDGTVIHPNTEYYYNGTHWMINYLSANNIEANSITADLIDAKNLTITDGEFVSTTTNGPVTTSTEIKDNHIAISKTDGTVNTKNNLAVDTEQGFAMKFTNNITGLTREASVNFQGVSTSDSNGNYAQLTPQGTKLSTDVPWTTLAATGGFSGSIQFAIQNGIAFFSLTQVLTPKMTAEAWYQIAQLPSGSKAIPSINRVTTAFANTAVWGFYVSTSGGLYLQSKTALNTPGSTSANTIASFPIG